MAVTVKSLFFNMLLHFAFTKSFLLNSSHTELTSFEFQHLSQLIVNEEQSRHYIENDVTSLEHRIAKLELFEQRVAKIEQDLKAKCDQEDLVAATTSLEAQMNATKTDLEQKADETEAALRQEINDTKAELKYVKHLLDKEQSNRRYIQREYTGLMLEFENLTRVYNDLIKTDREFGKILENLTKTFDTRLASLRDDIEAANVSSLLLQNNISTNSDPASASLAKISTLIASTDSLNVTSHYLQQKADYKSAFTVTGTPRNGSVGGTIIFPDIKYNLGNQHNESTGQFTCVYSGVYLFSLSIYKRQSAAHAWCWIRKNGSRQVAAISEPNDGYNTGSGSMVVHLVTGDIVDLGYCTPAADISNLSSFTGSLLHPD